MESTVRAMVLRRVASSKQIASTTSSSTYISFNSRPRFYLASCLRSQSHSLLRSSRLGAIRHVSSSTRDDNGVDSSAGGNVKAKGKGNILEQPDRFRPPSHGTRLKAHARSTTGSMGGFNQGMTSRERQDSKKKAYPNMFPEEGTRMHWFLTARHIHVAIAMGILAFLALISSTQRFLQTSPFAHLVPEISSLPYHPISYISECLAVYRLHTDYRTEQAQQLRRQDGQDEAKRRLYRRAHGIEDLNDDDPAGIDVRGLVPWDDGFSEPQRRRGGEHRFMFSGGQLDEMGKRPGETVVNVLDRRWDEDKRRRAKWEADEKAKEEQDRQEREAIERERKQNAAQKKRKVWFGIW